MCKQAQRDVLKQAKQRFQSILGNYGLVDNDLVCAIPRKSKPNVVGYYSHMSQFRSRARIVVDVAAIEAEFPDDALGASEQVHMTLAHEYGHVIAECIRFMESQGASFTAPTWRDEFENDEEEFAEDFARFCITKTAYHAAFWQRFIPAYVSDFNRLFSVSPEQESQYAQIA
ncbi:hypothetical protein [Paraburkholderia sp. A3RO-2L]|jgi:hypothetical protein|uniref:hypothetical protein n=1 Tax=unclassified Paraburkholderia TaxID=2615204 RepID=UPI003DAA42DA